MPRQSMARPWFTIFFLSRTWPRRANRGWQAPEEMKLLEDSPAYFRTRKRNQNPKPLTPVNLQHYEIDYDVIDPQLRALAAKQKSQELEFVAAAYTNDGVLLNSISEHWRHCK